MKCRIIYSSSHCRIADQLPIQKIYDFGGLCSMISEISRIEISGDVEIKVTDRSRSLKVGPFDSPHTIRK